MIGESLLKAVIAIWESVCLFVCVCQCVCVEVVPESTDTLTTSQL